MSQVNVLNMGLEQRCGQLYMQVWIKNVHLPSLEKKRQKICELVENLPCVSKIEQFQLSKPVTKMTFTLDSPCLNVKEADALCREIQDLFAFHASRP